MIFIYIHLLLSLDASIWREVKSTCGTDSKVDFRTGTISVDVRLIIISFIHNCTFMIYVVSCLHFPLGLFYGSSRV